MVDAEQTYFQPAIDLLVNRMQKFSNAHEPVVFNTIQCYLRRAPAFLQQQLDLASLCVAIWWSFFLA